MTCTKRESDILQFIERFWYVNWTSPTVREIAAGVGLSSPATVAAHLGKLVCCGLLERRRVSSRRVLYRVTASGFRELLK